MDKILSKGQILVTMAAISDHFEREETADIQLIAIVFDEIDGDKTIAAQFDVWDEEANTKLKVQTILLGWQDDTADSFRESLIEELYKEIRLKRTAHRQSIKNSKNQIIVFSDSSNDNKIH